MTRRERIIAALRHRETDKIPVDCGSMRSTGIMGMAYNRLKKHLPITGGETKMYDVPQQLCIPEQWYLDKFEVDSVDLARAFADDPTDWTDWRLPDGSPAKLPAWLRIEKREDAWVTINSRNELSGRMPFTSYYFDQQVWPLRGVRRDNFDDLAEQMGRTMWGSLSDPLWKNADKPDFYRLLRDTARRLYKSTDYAVMIGFGANLFEWGQFLYGTDEFLMNIISHKKEMEQMLDRLTEIHMTNLKPVLEAVSPYVQIIQMGDDLGMQSGPMLSPKLYHEMFFPRAKKIFRLVKDSTDMFVFLHSCGGIADFIPDLIEAGVDIINPVQITARGMEPERLKREFGKDIVFWGGGVDTQHALPNASPQKVREEVRKNCEIFMKGGGFVFSQVHNIQAGVPPENILAMYDELNKMRYR